MSNDDWRDISSAPRDGSWFVTACFGYGQPDYEVGCYDPSYFDAYVEVGDGLYRKEKGTNYEWRGFNNFHRATHSIPLPPPATQPDVAGGEVE